MYKGKKIRVKSKNEVIQHIEYLKQYYSNPEKVFIADGNFLCLNTDKILDFMELIKLNFKNTNRISCYTGRLDLINKTSEELKIIHNAGIDLFYMALRVAIMKYC